MTSRGGTRTVWAGFCASIKPTSISPARPPSSCRFMSKPVGALAHCQKTLGAGHVDELPAPGADQVFGCQLSAQEIVRENLPTGLMRGLRVGVDHRNSSRAEFDGWTRVGTPGSNNESVDAFGQQRFEVASLELGVIRRVAQEHGDTCFLEGVLDAGKDRDTESAETVRGDQPDRKSASPM